MSLDLKSNWKSLRMYLVPLSCICSRRQMSFIMGPPHLRVVSQFGSDERNEENREGPPDETQSICLHSYSMVMFRPREDDTQVFTEIPRCNINGIVKRGDTLSETEKAQLGGIE